MSLDDRKERVLRAIVSLYEKDAEPIGSGLLAEFLDTQVSSATLRNEMAMLTKLGLLEQPHTSAGRVPSAKGYRYYLDNLLPLRKNLSSSESADYKRMFENFDFEPEKLVQSAAKALSNITGYAVAATTPNSQDAYMAHYEILQVGRYSAAVLGVTNAGGVQTRVVKLNFELQDADCKMISSILNSALTFRAKADVSEEYINGMSAALGARAGALAYPALSAAYRLLEECGKEKVFFEGQQNLMDCCGASSDLRNLFKLCADYTIAKEYLSPTQERTTVLLGEDIQEYPLRDICFVTKRYHAGGGRTGSLSIIGPTRMPFTQIIPVLECFASLLGQSMTDNL